MASLKLFNTLKSSSSTPLIVNMQRSLLTKSLRQQKRYYVIISAVHSKFPQNSTSNDLANKCGKCKQKQ